ncbi:YadA-like family protein, partial [uncultured Megasphaera sp.]|uniref:YadA-like family protein n=1 Tax=uncultured Megasphaera sp. TaxID=165188 RepID=UPI0025976E50
DPSGTDHSGDTTGTWKSTAAAVSVGDASKNITRQITNVAAGTQDTDAVNVAQLKAISSTMNTDIAASKTHFYSVKSTDAKAKNYNNDGATAANALAAGVGANADKASAVAIGDTAYAGSANGVAIGTGSWIRSSDGKPNANGGDVAIGQDSHVDSYVNQGGSIALGQNARVENMYGNTEKSWAFGQTEFDGKNIPLTPGNEAGGIAIGRNSFARTGSLMVGSHMYKGAIADIDEVDGTDSQNLRDNFNNVNMTTLGTNSFNNGTFATVTGAYSATTAKKKIQNFAATVDGSLNSIESYKYQDKDAADNSGVASSIVGTANRIANSNNTTILGAGNEVTNSLTDITAPTEGGDSAKALQDTLKGKLQQDAKGAVVVSGIGNKVNSSHGVSVLGSRNVVNTTDNIQLLGDNREVTGATGSVIIGSADSKTTTSVTDATILGHNANVEKAGGVALGAGSVASREAGVAGYDPATKEASKNTSATWKATKAAVSVGKADGTMTRQITGVAAGSAATDAVNVAQLQKALAGAKDGNDTLKSDTNALKLDGNTLSMNVEDTAGHKVSGSVDLSKFAQAVDTNTTYTLTGQANQDNTTTITLEDNNGKKNSVTVATKDTRNTVKAGENVTLDTKDNADGSHEYTVNVKADGKVEAGSTKIVSGGTVYNETRVAKDGNFVKQSNTAGENLSALDNQVTANTESIYHMNGRISDLDNRVNKVGAGAAALAALHPLDFDPDDKWDFAVGYGNYRNANSVALGAFYRPNEDTMFSLGTNFGNGENMFNAGLSFKIGQGGSGITTSKTAMAKKIESLENTVDQQDKKIAELEALVKEQGEMIRQYVGKK